MDNHDSPTPLHFDDAFQLYDDSQTDTSNGRKRKFDSHEEEPPPKKRKVINKEVRDLILNQINNDQTKYNHYATYYLLACRK